MIDPKRVLLTAVFVILTGGAPSLAGAMYTVKDLGVSSQSQVEYFNLTGSRFLQIDALGQVSPAPRWEGSTILPAGMRPLDVSNNHGSPDGRYVVGTAYEDATPYAAWAGFVSHDGTARALIASDSLDSSTFSGAFGVNNSGTVVGDHGSTTGPGGSRAMMVDSAGHVTDLGTLGGGYNAALAINSAGTIVGVGQLAGNSPGAFRAFLSDGHSLADLNTLIDVIPNFLLVSATGINDVGQIAAYGRFADDPRDLYHEILLSPLTLGIPVLPPSPVPNPTPDPVPSPQPNPVPEPTATALFFAVAFAGGRKAWRARKGTV